MASLEANSDRMIWVVIGLGLAVLIGSAAYLYFNTNVATWLGQIGSAMTSIKSP